MDGDKSEIWITVEVAAKLCGRSEATVRRWADEGRITARQPGGFHKKMDVERSSLLKFMEGSRLK